MQMTTEARAWLDATVRRILARHPLGDAERAGITYEIMSHLHAAGEARATAAGRAEVSREDLETALAEAGGESGMAAAFVQPLARPVESAPLGPRFGAFAIDMVLAFLALLIVHGTLEYILRAAGVHVSSESARPAAWSSWYPWGVHDSTLGFPFQAAFGIASGLAVLGYFVWLEGRDGRTLGKRAVDLRVMRLDGAPMTYRVAFIRNVVKLVPPLFVLDTLIMLFGASKKRQRLSDKIAETIVVRT